MNIREISKKQELEDIGGITTQSSFLQSWDWGEFQSSVGIIPKRVIIEDNRPVQGLAHPLKSQFLYLYIPRMPELSAEQFEEYLKYTKSKGFVFARIEPVAILPVSHFKTFKTRYRQPKQTWLLDISLGEDELLAHMHTKTRYNIRLSERKGVKIERNKDVDFFWRLHEETIKRDAFSGHTKDYYKKMLPLDSVHQFNAIFEGEVIATIITIQSGKTYTYLHGASGSKHRNMMAPYLLQWKAIKHAKSLGCTTYDFWGVAPETKEGEGKVTSFHNFTWGVNHPFTGITRFKVGFGGEYKEYADAVDIVFRPILYKVYRFLKKLL